MADPNQINNNAAASAMPMAPGSIPLSTPPVQGAPAPAPTPTISTPPPSAGGSPWDEDLPEPAQPQKPITSVMGSLEPNNQAAPQAAPFNVPENIEEKVGQKVPAQQYITPEDNTGVNNIFEPDDQLPEQGINNAGVAAPPPMNPFAQAPREGFFKRLFAKKPKTAPAQTASPAPITNTATASNPMASSAVANPAQAIGKPKFAFLQNQKLIAVLGVMAFLVFIVGLTELGLISIGAEKVYGAIGIERFWGGLPANPEGAVIKSALTMQKHPKFKAKGEITLSVDSSIKSDITSPLFSYVKQNYIAMKDSNVSSPIPAVKTVTNTNSADIYDMYDIGSTGGSSSSTSSSSSNSNTGSYTGDTLNAADGSATIDSDLDDDTVSSSLDDSSSSTSDSDYDLSSQSETSSINDFKSSVSLKTSTEGVSAEISPDDSSDSGAINLMLKNGDLLVKSNTIKFSSNATANKWLSYKIDKLRDKTIQKDIFGVGSDSGFSVKGKREANEKVGNTRCYRYKVDSLEIGNALSAIGITSDMVQNISGKVWIGISDKTIRKVDLKIITPISSAVSSIAVNLEFYDFDVDNKLSFPDDSEIIEPVALTTETVDATTTTTLGAATTSVATPTERDSKRKADVGLILDALSKYKAATGSYPISKTLLKLDTTGNMIEQALVPGYLSAMPLDPTAGWYYAYKSNEGKNCSISARLEDPADPLGQTIGGVLLYLKYNDN